MIDLRDIGLPEVPLIGVNIQTSAKRSLAAHRHSGIFEAVYMVRGKQVFSIEGREYTLTSNDVFIAKPGALHGSGSHLMEKAFFYWLQLRVPQKGKSILCLDKESSLELSRTLGAVELSRFAGNQKVGDAFEQIFELYQNKPPSVRLAVSSKIVGLLLNIIDCAENPKQPFITTEIAGVIEMLAQNRHRFVSIDEMAEIAGLSASRFKCKFKQQTGLPPAEFQLRKKLQTAEAMLKSTPKTITRIAHELGFSSSQYFSTAYKRFNKKSPAKNRHLNY